ncbi:GNAT family N-acetyltransferase [Sphingomonas sanguinis]|jgi:GNAT superfamily N-acetyltransferase|uniref:GNAT family N-acetyltransferase n=1 Tax=Sphingomonas sanguinis TaxID=33051 RepID=A0A7Y7UQX4_9SPHN|nr:GNAT family N-acetyltransferase [Sphingomonas sanguinis]MBZ6382125.1 GNAT family N-acetyltransferase [Sphingomonas sanguinis]NNG49068.1 GNAT family N-acetyltransferase [Sphingomonas sanguinis]NNG52681.1 GNAT family N-acetyltransferase [Sphingomonas sanguinis]NVP31424.1 GNAT family N-acetyltransferase [Sphingomonas sanguinis]
MALIPVDAAEIATIVTTLEMRDRPRPRPLPASPLGLVAWKWPDPAKYRTLFARVGAPWLWFSRLVMDDPTLTAIIHDPAVSVFAVVDRAGIEVGLLELDHRRPRECEIGYFGLIPELAGQGHGRWLMAQALMRAWMPGVERVWVHTCTLDHPSALNFYRKQGFVPVSRAIETFPDPRTLGLLPPEAAPQIPRLV